MVLFTSGMVHQKRHPSIKFIEAAINVVKQNRMKLHFAIYLTLAFLHHGVMGCLNGLKKIENHWHKNKFQFVLIIGYCVYKLDDTTGVLNGPLHKVHFRTYFLSLQFFSMFSPKVLKLVSE